MTRLKTFSNRVSGLSDILKILVAVLSVGVTTGILQLAREYLSTPIVALLFLLPVLLSTTQWGLSAGIISAVCSFLFFNFFFIPPYYTLIVHQTQDVLVLFVFLVVAVVISQLVGRAKSNLSEAQDREREVLHLYDLGLNLAAGRNPTEIGRILATKLSEVFTPSFIHVEIEAEGDKADIRIPEGNVHDSRTGYVLPLTVSRGKLGTIHLTKVTGALNEIEFRLLRALISQGALAIERAILSEVETRAMILGESDKLKSALLASVSHELRTPLVTIKAAATSLRSGAVDRQSEAADDLLAALDEEVDHLNQIVGDLLNMSRIEAGALNLQREWNVLAEIVDTTLFQMGETDTTGRIEVDVSEDLPLLSVDPVLIQQVFRNLISNSLKYAPPDTRIQVTANLSSDDNGLLVTVRNQGPHVAQEHLEHIFDKFHRVTDRDRIPGMGLGLSICKGIVEAHGGRIWASNLVEGFAFHFVLPLNTGSEPVLRLPERDNL